MSIPPILRVVIVVMVLAIVPAALWAYARFGERTPATVHLGSGSLSRQSDSRPGIVGVGGCTASACHGGDAKNSLTGQAGERWPCSATHFLAADPHGRAYRTLELPASQRIMERLGLPSRTATAEPRCLACHANPSLAEAEPTARVTALLEQGVSCEACHGNAGTWLHEHTHWNPQQRSASGMTALNTHGDRALACAACHVGARADAARSYPVRDMNHDMIAAGHPRLESDYSTLLRRLPTHWNERDRSSDPPQPRRPNEGAFVWLVGRLAAAEAACELLADRAERAAQGTETPWPEFAEFRCADCHHRVPSVEPVDRRNVKPGALRWQSLWPITAIAGGGSESPLFQNTQATADSLQDVLNLVTQRHPPPLPTRDAARQLASRLRTARRQLTPADVPRLDDRLLQTVRAGEDLDWDSACQVYYGLCAVRGDEFSELREALRVPAGTVRYRPPRNALLALESALKWK